MTDSTVWQLLGNVVVAGASAWFGALFGVRRAIESVRKERAFDRRLKWYEDTIDAIQEVRFASGLYAFALRNHRDDLPDLTQTAHRLIPRMGELISKAIVYAPASTVRLLRQASEKIQEFNATATETLKHDAHVVDFAAVVDSFSNYLGETAFDLARDVRDQLGLGTISLQDIQ